MKNIISGLLCLIVLGATANAGDLYRIWVTSESDALELRESGASPVATATDGYLVLVDSKSIEYIEKSGFKAELLAEDIQRENLAIDIQHDPTSANRFPIVYEDGQLRIYRVGADIWARADSELQLAPILAENIPIEYARQTYYNPRATKNIVDLEYLMDQVNQDSLTSYTERLQAFYRRIAGSDSMHAASAWIKAKFESFGYDSVVFDSFTFQSSSMGLHRCRNVVATKVGSRHPEWEIVVGGHMDAGSTSPGADDNGSGTAGTIEIARILAGIDTDVTFRFITFDGEEWGLYGSWHYANWARTRGDHIIYMLNMDMIAHYTNYDKAKLYYGSQTAFSELWVDLADSLAGITATMNGSSGGSDHKPFIENGYQATFVQEYDFSTVYHSPHDSTTYLNFEYMRRMVGASLITVYTVNILPPPVIITSIIDGGDGQSLQLNWLPMDPERIDHYWIYYWPDGTSDVDSVQVMDGEQSSAIVTGLTENQEYGFCIFPYNADGQTSAEYEVAYGTPYSIPGMLTGLGALPVMQGIKLTWEPNPELDISHYRVVRDQSLLPDIVAESWFIDDDPDLGKYHHNYLVFAVDIDGNSSDTVGAEPVLSKAAWLDEGRILAINRSHVSPGLYLVDETVTGEYLREALFGFDYDYYSDTAHQEDEKASDLSLYDLIDYELVIIGGESARLDDLGGAPSSGGRLDTLAYYLSIGGKAIVFGRWGELDFEAILPYEPGDPGYSYNQYFGITSRNLVMTTSSGSELQSDLIGAHAQLPGYPDLGWDSLATVSHSQPYTDASGIPCVAYPTLDQPGIEILYTYNSSDDGGTTEGQPLAWRNNGPDYQYVYYEIPLSFMERGAAVSALGRNVQEFGFTSGATEVAPDTIDVWAEGGVNAYVLLGDLTGGYDVFDIDTSTITINDILSPAVVEILPPPPDFVGDFMMLTVASSDFANTYGEILGDGNAKTYTVSWNYWSEAETRTLMGDVVVNGYICGDPNTDGAVNVGDAVFLIKWTFSGGPPPYPYLSGDVNSDGSPNVGDAVHLINYIFKGGGAPDCPDEYPVKK